MATTIKPKRGGTHPLANRLDLLLQMLDDDEPDSEAALWTQPTEQQLTLINKWVPSQAAPLRAEELAVITFVASDNFVDLSMVAWSMEGLLGMRDRFPGRPFILDHAWYSIEQSRGFVFDTRLVKYTKPPDDINLAGYGEANRMQMNRDGGYYQVELDVAIAQDICTLKDLRFRRAAKVSTGTLISRSWDRGYLCPLCNIDFAEPECPHLIPYPWQSTSSKKIAAPYAIRMGIPYVVELSLCVSGQVPAAEVV